VSEMLKLDWTSTASIIPPFPPEWTLSVEGATWVVKYGFQNSWGVYIRGEAEEAPDDSDYSVALVFGDSPQECMLMANAMLSSVYKTEGTVEPTYLQAKVSEAVNDD